MFVWLRMTACFSLWECVRHPCCWSKKWGNLFFTCCGLTTGPCEPVQTPKHKHILAKHTPNPDTNALIIWSIRRWKPKTLFSWYEVNRASDSSVVLCVSFAPWPFRRRSWPRPSSNFPHHIQIRRPAVSLIRANVLNHLSHGSSPACTPSLLNHQHLNLAPVIAVAGGNTLRDWGGWLRRAESTFSYLR